MRQINRSWLSLHCSLWSIIFTLLLPPWTFGVSGTAGRDTWKGYTPEQKELAIAGFLHCYRAASSHYNAFERTNVAGVTRILDETEGAKGGAFGGLILQALKDAPSRNPDLHAEHWSGPYGFSTGLWWRGLENPDRQAYVQGVFWCVEAAPAHSVTNLGGSVPDAVNKLNNWYVVTDDDWKNPRSNQRVDVPVVVAMERTGIVSIRPAKRQ